MSFSLVLVVSALLFLIILNGLFIALSAALMHSKIRRLEDEEFKVKFGEAFALSYLKSASLHSLSIQAGRLIILFGIVYLLIHFVQLDVFGDWITGSDVLPYFFHTIIVFIIALTMLALSQIALAIAYSQPERTVCYLIPFFSPFLVIFSPLGKAAEVISQFLNRYFSLATPSEALNNVDVEELVDLVNPEDVPEEDQDELAMLKGVFDLSSTEVAEVMTPRQDVKSLHLDLKITDFLEQLSETDFSRLLVIGEELDDVKGILLLRDLVQVNQDNDIDQTEKTVKEYIRPVISVSCTENLLKLLSVFREENAHFAVVRDEHGGVDGIVTMEDVLEEIVGEIFDESDDPNEEQECRATITGDLLVDGGTPIDDLNEEYQLNLPEGDYDTIAGFIIHRLGKMPNLGEIVSYNGFQLVVEDYADNRINQVRVIINTKD